MHGGFSAVEPVQLSHPLLYTAVDWILKHVPLQAAVVGPLADLTKLAPHEHQFFPRLSVHVTEQKPEVGKAIFLVARHFADQRPLAVDDFIVRQRQHEVFLK